MPEGLYTVDFHAHIQGRSGMANLCAEERRSGFYSHLAPVLEKLAHVTEPIHDEPLRKLALHYRDCLSRFVYARLGNLALMETLRLFKTRDVNSLIESMDRNGINHVAVLSIEPLTITSQLIKETACYRDRISIFASVDRNQKDPAGYLRSLIDSGAVKGIKIHPVVGGYTCGEFYARTKPLAQLAHEENLPVIIHTGHIPVENLKGISGCNEISAIEPLIAEFPTVRFILAHIGWESWRAALDLAKRYSNAYVETSWQPARIIRRAVDALGANRVIFGSDFPLFSQSLALEQLRAALSPLEFAMVASTNAIRLLGLAPSPEEARKVLGSV